LLEQYSNSDTVYNIGIYAAFLTHPDILFFYIYLVKVM